MSVDACKLTSTSSIFLKKLRPTTPNDNNNTAIIGEDNDEDNNNIDIQVKKSRSTSLNKLQSVGLSLVASVTKKRNTTSNSTTANVKITTAKTNTSESNKNKKPDVLLSKNHISTNSLPTIKIITSTPQPPHPPTRLKPSISARPFSQFFFPIKEEKEEQTSLNEQRLITTCKKSIGRKTTNERELLLLSPQQTTTTTTTQRNKQQQQRLLLRARQLNSSSKRHSIAVDFVDDCNNTIPSSNTSSRSSSLKTVKNHSIVDNVVIATNDILDITQSEIGFLNTTSTTNIKTIPTSKKRNVDNNNNNLSRSASQQQQSNRLSGITRARTVLGLDSLKSRELRAIHVWKDTVSQLSIDELASYDGSNNSSIVEEGDDDEDDDELYEILSHSALRPEHPLERQRFVRRSSPKDLAMMKFILNELIATEKSYNQLLLLIQNRYMEPMIEASQTKDPLVKSSDIPLLFNHLPELVQLSDRLLDQFNNTNNIGHVFRSIESDLVVFLKYAMHYRTNIKTIRKACSNVLFVKIDQETLARRDTNRLGMSDYFIAPIQRIPRYCLLIKDLQKYTHPMDSNYVELDFALKTLTGLAVAMDHVQKKAPSPITRTSYRTL